MAKVAFLFPGQGAQLVGMGKALAEQLPAARALFDRANALLGYDLAQLCFDGPQEKLDSTVHSQPALFVCSLAALEKLRYDSPEIVEQCQAAAGLSLGEYTALVFAGVMTFDDGLRLVAERGAAMQAAAELRPSGMVSVLGVEPEPLAAMCDAARGDDVLQIANLLCPGNIAISGGAAALDRFVAQAEQDGVRYVRLSVAGAFHTAIMQPAVERLTKALRDVTMSAPRIPVVSNVDALPHDDPEAIRALLVRQVVSAVHWEDSLRYLIAQGHDPFYELGPGRVLRGLLKRIDRKLACEGVGE
ncbi:MAG: ACP S-malonyltransferase [Planctomycetia bacterium]|nr:ACP S-malonyltransferase [Planctomycetia bacterium]